MAFNFSERHKQIDRAVEVNPEKTRKLWSSLSREQDRRAAILESLRAGKSPKEIIEWFGYKKTEHWMDRVAAGREYVFQQEAASTHKAKKTQAWLQNNLPYHWSPDFWPPSSPDCNPLDYYVWGTVEAKVNAKPHNTKDALKTTIEEVMTTMDKGEVTRACGRFRSTLEQVIARDGGYIE
ncbi:uncharacterized protein LOC128856410 [Anastrepha ludens]|uniref:uncharacterized protein LOC128856410 n=1 Tax=Anastrepha ludens TaxID=28586 RepID=UPI0023AE9979|nr:uncharacterized protein LOC128856410 [Anastrepha ludens]